MNMAHCTDSGIEISKDSVDKVMHGKSYIIASVCNYGYLRIVKNWAWYLKKLNIPNYLVFCLDNRLYDKLLELGINAYHVKTCQHFPTNSQVHRTCGFSIIVHGKITVVYELLKAGFDILLSDADTIWLKDPMKYIAVEGYDIQMQSDARSYDKEFPLQAAYFNTGFYYVKSNAKTKQLFEKVLLDMASSQLKDDQISFNKVIKEEGGGIDFLPPDSAYSQDEKKISIKILDPLQFPNGAIYFNMSGMCGGLNINPVVIHANFFNQVNSKIEAIRSAGYWRFESKDEMMLWKIKSFVYNIYRHAYGILRDIKVLRDIKRKFF
ncbi:MAG: putative nucleotide-diphospho-sugar transferase [Candidatus Omnitrophota bacterium]